ncbi:type II secretion system F family protein [Actimicrobium sp. CCC2.4]|uniref:type II secretion system F family protein n=1 Tax=Actimicrobium sp. CCC2.4 TaxID=3048606 RepID=UPI002AC98DBC|nr:type II secretion system F family protein [Actimicrobium sp. CCC2.4]MEB0134697.1 type II secretion system F family protein [Actimicrobium sp. CCC2.4]WPX30640.1 type II secretion system F family protein [Actimicrobium sp. CCC2.4]
MTPRSFDYKARDARGQYSSGVLDGADAGAVAGQLASAGLIPVSITLAARNRRGDPSGWWARLTAEKVKPIDIQLFSRQLYTLLKAGVPILRSLTSLQESAINKTFRQVLQDIRNSLDGGRELSAAMQRHPLLFSGFYLSMVRVGEMTGRLEEVFLRLYDHLEFERDMRQRMQAALRYPSFVALAMGLALITINLFVIPVFANVYAGFRAELPLMTRMLIGVSTFMVNYWLLILIGLAATTFALRMAFSTTRGRYLWDKYTLRLPVIGNILLKGTLARFARSLALSNQSGVPIVQGLGVVALTVDNSYVAGNIDRMREGVERGDSILRSASATGVFTPVVLQMIAIGEETGELDALLNEIAGMYERDLQDELKTLSAQIEPLLIVALGVMVLVLALGIFLPIWDLSRVALRK